ncbi:MAG: SDR family oxidoreductase [Anaerolineae bacterium]|nr:SDR family oxidoreductase [Anaerolineae bacterium]
MQTILITGANRGIGLEVTRQYLQHGDVRLFVTARHVGAADALNALAAQHPDCLMVIPLDVADPASIETAVQQVAAQTNALDVLVNNAGINPPRNNQLVDTVTPETIQQVIQVNTIGPLLMARACLDLLQRGNNPRIVNLSSGLGSLERRTYGGLYAYSTSKAALNSVTRGLAVDLVDITVVALHPGWVQTDMGGVNASLTPPESAAGIIRVIDGLTKSDNGCFYQWDGQAVAW